VGGSTTPNPAAALQLARANGDTESRDATEQPLVKGDELAVKESCESDVLGVVGLSPPKLVSESPGRDGNSAGARIFTGAFNTRRNIIAACVACTSLRHAISCSTELVSTSMSGGAVSSFPLRLAKPSSV
jgi:hypothetical protein